MKTLFNGCSKRIFESGKTLLWTSCLAVFLTAGNAHAAFVDRGTNVVFDTTTKLDWEQNPLTSWVNYADANNYINNLTLDGGGWRLPTIAELIQLYKNISAETGCVDCSGDQDLFHGLTLGYWTTALYWAGQDGAFYVGFWKGPDDVVGLFQTSSAGVIAVRDGAPISEPGSLALLGLAALSGIFAARRRKEA